jgi:hypothetical protein
MFVSPFSVVGLVKNLKVTYKVLLEETWMWIAARMIPLYASTVDRFFPFRSTLSMMWFLAPFSVVGLVKNAKVTYKVLLDEK